MHREPEDDSLDSKGAFEGKNPKSFISKGGWDELEASQEDKTTKKISWVPILGPHIPDETQKMRIRLRAALIDVATGKWSMVIPDPVEDTAASSKSSRVKTDQDQVESLKKKGYAALAGEISRYFTL